MGACYEDGKGYDRVFDCRLSFEIPAIESAAAATMIKMRWDMLRCLIFDWE